MEKYFFSIPLYRHSKEDFYKKIESFRDKSFALEHNGPNSTYFDLVNNYSWQFNEIIGWVRLYFHFACLQADLVTNKHKRKSWQIRLFKKNFQINGRLTEMIPNLNHSSIDITNDVIQSLVNSKNENRNIKEYHFDFSEFKQVGYALDWKAIKKTSNPNSGFPDLEL